MRFMDEMRGSGDSYDDVVDRMTAAVDDVRKARKEMGEVVALPALASKEGEVAKRLDEILEFDGMPYSPSFTVWIVCEGGTRKPTWEDVARAVAAGLSPDFPGVVDVVVQTR